MSTKEELSLKSKREQYKIVPFEDKYLEAAVNLFLDSYKNEKAKNPILPSRAINEPEWILNSLKPLVNNGGVAIVLDDRLIAYMITGYDFPFKGQNTLLVPVFCHGSVTKNKEELYQRMYMQLASEWAKNGKHIHIISHFAYDTILQETLYQIGFGAFLAERVRNLSAVCDSNEVSIIKEKDYSKLVGIQVEHMRYYPDSPIFISKDNEIKNARTDLESHSKNGDVFLVYYERRKPSAYFIVGDSTTGVGGFLLKETNTAQIKSAYVKSHIRDKGIGTAILHQATNWAQKQGYERLFVEHETANYYGGNFWRKHFIPYLYFSLRYIDNTINYQ